MLVLKIMVICSLILCVVNFLFGLHVLITSNKMINSVENWAVEIDRSNFNYIKQEFARLKYENGLVLPSKDENNNDNKQDENE